MPGMEMASTDKTVHIISMIFLKSLSILYLNRIYIGDHIMRDLLLNKTICVRVFLPIYLVLCLSLEFMIDNHTF